MLQLNIIHGTGVQFKPDAVSQAVRDELDAVGADLAAGMSARAPVDTGALSGGIRIRRYTSTSGRAILLIVGPGRGVRGNRGKRVSRYAHLAERQSPYVRPTGDELSPAIPERLRRAAKRAL